MHFLIKWIFIVFCWGGIGLLIWFLMSIKKDQQIARINLAKLRTALKLLLSFIIIATIGFCDYFTRLYGSVTLQIINNLLVGIIFVLFILSLKNSIEYEADIKK